MKVQGNDAFVLAASSASLAWSCTATLSLRGSSLGCMGLRGTAKTSKHFVLDLMAANRADNTLARVEMETEEVGVCVCGCVCVHTRVCVRMHAEDRDVQLIESLTSLFINLHMPRAG